MSLRLTGGHDGRNLQEVGDSVSPKRNQLYASYQTREACAYLLFDGSIERLSVKFFDVYSKPYFHECMLLYSLQQSFLTNCAKAYRPVHNGNTFLV